jgi:hypothetical protein
MTLRTPGVCCPWRTHDDAPDMPMSRRRAGSCARQQHADPAVRRATSWALRCTDASCWPDLAQHECAVVRRRSGCCSSNPAVPNWSRLTTRTRDRRTDTRGTPTHWLRRARIGYFIDVHVSAAEGGGRRASSARGGLRPSRSTLLSALRPGDTRSHDTCWWPPTRPTASGAASQRGCPHELWYRGAKGAGHVASN